MSPSAPRPPSVGWLDVLTVLGRFRRLLAIAPIVTTAIAAAVTLLLPPAYTATTRLLPPHQNQGAAVLLNQLGGGLAAAAGEAFGKNPGDIFVAMLRSDSVADRMIAQFDLKTLYRARYQYEARARLAKASRFKVDKDGLILIETDARTPQLAADMAIAYVAELQRLTNTLAVTDAAKRRVFFERQVTQAREALADSETKLRAAIDAGGLVSVDAQSRGALETAARLRAQITAKQLEVAAMRAYATSAHPEMARAEQQLASMRQELVRLESGFGGEATSPGPAGGGRGLENIRLLRDVKYHEQVAELLTKQYELARVEESKEAPLIQVLDPAQPPERRSSPKRAAITAGAFLGSLFLSIVGAFTLNAARLGLEDDEQRRKLRLLRDSWRIRRAA